MRDDQAGRYRLVRRLGAGGMADVFRAELVGAEGITRDLVVKRILPSLSNDAEAVAMFVEEARIAARLHHPNVVQVYEFGRSGDRYFLAMELVDGCKMGHATITAPTVEEAISLARQVQQVLKIIS